MQFIYLAPSNHITYHPEYAVYLPYVIAPVDLQNMQLRVILVHVLWTYMFLNLIKGGYIEGIRTQILQNEK